MKYLKTLILSVLIACGLLRTQDAFCQTDTICIEVDTILHWATKKQLLLTQRDSLVEWLSDSRVQNQVDSIRLDYYTTQLKAVRKDLRRQRLLGYTKSGLSALAGFILGALLIR